MDSIQEYVKARDEAVKSMDLDKFKAFITRTTPDGFTMPSDEVLQITMRKMAVHITNLDVETRVNAFRWLLEHGYDFSLRG